MRQVITIVAALLLLASCGNSEQEQAEKLLENTRAYLNEGNLMAARAGIDSLRRTYPNIVTIRRGALLLYQEVELKLAQDELRQTDSLLQIANHELETLQKQVDADKTQLKATPEELTQLTLTRIRRDSIRTQFETLGAKIRYIHKKQKELNTEEEK